MTKPLTGNLLQINRQAVGMHPTPEITSTGSAGACWNSQHQSEETVTMTEKSEQTSLKYDSIVEQLSFVRLVEP